MTASSPSLRRVLVVGGFALLVPASALAAAGGEWNGFARGLLSLAIVLVAAKLGALVHRWRLPVVLGEILAGVVLGNLALAGIGVRERMAH